MMRAKNDTYSGAVSADALEQVNFQNYWLVARRRWKPTASVFAATVLLAGVGASMQKPTYSASGKLLVRSNPIPSLTGLGGELTGRVSNLTTQSNPVRTEAESILSQPVLQRTIDALQLKDNQGKPVETSALATRIKVRDVAGTDVLRVTYEDENPERAAQILNQLLDEYLKSNVAENRSEATAAKEFIAAQLPKTEATVRQADSALRSFKERNGISDLKGQEESLSRTIQELDQAITSAQTQLREANTRFTSLSSKLRMNVDEALTISALSQSSGVQEALVQLQEVQSQLEVERTRYQEKHPAIVNLVAKETRLRNLLQSRIGEGGGTPNLTPSSLAPGELRQNLMQDFVDAELESQSLSSRLASLVSARDFYRQRIVQVPRLEQEQRQLERQLEAAQTTYESLLKRLQEVELTEKQNVGTARLIEQAVIPDTPTGSNAKIVFLIGLALATLLALGLAAFLELQDTSIKTIKDARELFGYTWLGTIPSFGKPSTNHRKVEWTVPELPVRDAPRSMTSSSYRMLQANLRFLSLDKKLKSIVITSSVPREGKSTIAANLAAIMSQLGRRVLLIDADMHNPSQHHIWNVTNVSGLSNVLVNQTDPRDAIVPVLDNLDLLSSGVIPPSPLALLDSKRMVALLQSLEQRYDFVIIDSPPLVVEAEALTLGKITDGVLLAVRPGVVDFSSAITAKELLQQSSQNILGMVINDTMLENNNEVYSSYSNQGEFSTVPPARAV